MRGFGDKEEEEEEVEEGGKEEEGEEKQGRMIGGRCENRFSDNSRLIRPYVRLYFGTQVWIYKSIDRDNL